MPNDDTTTKVSENTQTTAEKQKESPRGGNAIRLARIRGQFLKSNKNIK